MSHKKLLLTMLMLEFLILFLLQNNLLADERTTEGFKLTEDHEKMMSLINAKRIEREIKPLSIHRNLTEASTERLEAFKQDEKVKTNKESLEEKIKDFILNLGQNAFMAKASSVEKAFNQLIKNKKFKKIIYDSKKMTVALNIVRVSPEKVLVVVYFTERPIEWGLFSAELVQDIPSTGPKSTADSWTITGTSKMRYLKFILHEGGIFYFECESCKKVIKEISVEKDGSFSANFPVGILGKKERRLAVLSRDNQSEGYVLVDYLKSP